MTTALPLAKPSARYLVHAAGLLLVAAGLVTWGRLLFPSTPPPKATPVRTTEPDATAGALAAWFGPGELRANVVVKGLIKGGNQGVVVLAVNDGPPKPYRVGDELARSVKLTAIEADAVVIDKAGTSQRIAAPTLPRAATPGIVRAAPAR